MRIIYLSFHSRYIAIRAKWYDGVQSFDKFDWAVVAVPHVRCWLWATKAARLDSGRVNVDFPVLDSMDLSEAWCSPSMVWW